MIIGILQFELSIAGATSLKDKRRVVASLKDRLHREHQVSVAEVDAQDRHGTAVLALAMVGTDVRRCQSTLDRVLEKLRQGRDFVLTDSQMEILTGR